VSGEVSSDERPEKEESEGVIEDIAEEIESANVGDGVLVDILLREKCSVVHDR
jgi:hypothetical protein